MARMLVSGRSLRQLNELFSPLPLGAAGLHGLERRNLCSEVVRAMPVLKVFEQGRRRLSTFADRRSDARLALPQGARTSGRG
jgi:trehalose-6-phosphatase